MSLLIGTIAISILVYKIMYYLYNNAKNERYKKILKEKEVFYLKVKKNIVNYGYSEFETVKMLKKTKFKHMLKFYPYEISKYNERVWAKKIIFAYKNNRYDL